MGARAEAAERTVNRIHDAAISLFRSRPFQEVTLQAVADASGVTLQTILRRFGSKENLFTSAGAAYAETVMQQRTIEQPADIASVVHTLVASYEETGDLNWRGVTQEDRFPLVKERFDDARRRHRRWVETGFADAIGRARGAERTRRILLLLAATDFYVWKLYRRDLGLSRKDATARMIDLVTALARDFTGRS
jgi:AcrR family transcriptional regulator